MPNLKTLPAAAVLMASLGWISAPAVAATAHNSQAGAFGPTSNTCAATPYFDAGGCLSSFVEDPNDDVLPPPDVPYRQRAAPRFRTLPPPSDD